MTWRGVILVLAWTTLQAPRAAAETGDPLVPAARACAAGEMAEVVRLLKPDTEGTGSSPERRLLLARALVGGPDATPAHGDEAATLLRGLQALLPHLGDRVAWLHGRALVLAGRPAEAAEVLARVVTFKPPGSYTHARFVDRARLRRAEALAAAGDAKRAVKAFERLLHTNPEADLRPRIRLALAQNLELLGRRPEAGRLLQQIWLDWPQLPLADRAKSALDRLAAAKVKLPEIPWWRRLKRLRTMRRYRRIDEALAELDWLALTVRDQPVRQDQLRLERARLLIRADRCADALPLLTTLDQRVRGSAKRRLRRKRADCLARLGQLERAVALHMVNIYNKNKVLRRSRLGDALWAVKLLAEYGQYGRALSLADDIWRVRRSSALRFRRTWLAYRAGKDKRALAGFRWQIKHLAGDTSRARYWMARTRARAGEREPAQKLYRELVAKHGRGYYGILARARLAELDSQKPPPVRGSPSCLPLDPVGPPRPDPLPTMLAALQRDHGALFPQLPRVQALWRLGLRRQARRELQLLVLDVRWAQVRGRPKAWLVHPRVERAWFGAPPPRRRWTKRHAAIRRQAEALRLQVGRLAEAAGLFSAGWRLTRRKDDPARRRYPRAYNSLVLELARQHRLDPNLLWSIMRTESSYRTDAVSRVGAMGLMQVMPATGRLVANAMKLKDFQESHLFEPKVSLTMGAWYLHAVLDKFAGQVRLAAAAYNGGPHNMARWLDQRGAHCAADAFVEEIPYRESRRYAKKILRLLALHERVHCGDDTRRAQPKLTIKYKKLPDF